jgi:hypothetical protein
MNKKKIACLVICTLMIVAVFPVVGFPLQTAEMKISNIAHTEHKSPTPAYAPTPPYATSRGAKQISFTLLDLP